MTKNIKSKDSSSKSCENVKLTAATPGTSENLVLEISGNDIHNSSDLAIKFDELKRSALNTLVMCSLVTELL